ncbi:MAG TPA: hypothetical protein DEA08_35305, partial [Planctomycetes bacterium]|nr:hypothetical protein [Planctomycetota bacterium]
MNFFAHAVLALRRREDPAWVLGSMAPDFASMAGLRLARGEGEPAGALGEGIAFHHRSDDAFHGAPRFLELMKSARVDLRERGVGLGAALAISHVGVELLLDGWLVEQGGVPEPYREAVASAEARAEALSFQGDEEAARRQWRSACARLAQAPLPEGYTDPRFVAERLVRILARRPRL